MELTVPVAVIWLLVTLKKGTVGSLSVAAELGCGGELLSAAGMRQRAGQHRGRERGPEAVGSRGAAMPGVRACGH